MEDKAVWVAVLLVLIFALIFVLMELFMLQKNEKCTPSRVRENNNKKDEKIEADNVLMDLAKNEYLKQQGLVPYRDADGRVRFKSAE